MNDMIGLAHDMRAPLAAIDALCTLLERHAGEPKALLHDAQRIRAACAQLMQMAETMLDEEGALRCPAPCTTAAIVRAAASLYEERLDMRLTGDVDAGMLADAPAVRRILVNLLSNAAKYSHGRIKLRAHARREGDAVCLRVDVEDNGPGMSEETLAGLFLPGARGKETADVPGRGLGLCAALELARRMGGSISVKSRLGEGSIFAFEASFPPAQDAKAALAGKRFLVAEDNMLAREALCELLDAHGAQAVGAADGKAAVEAFARSPEGHFDAALLDVFMPGMDGFAAARAIRAMDRSDAAQILLVALTGAASQGATDAAQALGMRHAVKPMTMDRLAQMMADQQMERE